MGLLAGRNAEVRAFEQPSIQFLIIFVRDSRIGHQLLPDFTALRAAILAGYGDEKSFNSQSTCLSARARPLGGSEYK